MKLAIKISTIAILLLLTSCSSAFKEQGKTDKLSGSEISLGITPGQVSEYKNKTKVKTERVSARLNIGKYHLSARKDHITSPGTDDPNDSLINRDFDWIGVGLHTNKGTYITYHRDVKSNDYWLFDITSKIKIRNKTTGIFGLYHLDHNGGGAIKSGGRRTTGAKIGVQYNITKHFGVNGIYEIANNSAKYVEDRFLINLVLTK